MRAFGWYINAYRYHGSWKPFFSERHGINHTNGLKWITLWAGPIYVTIGQYDDRVRIRL